MKVPAKRTRGRPKSFNDQTENTIVRSLDRGMLILGVLAERDGVSLSELSERSAQSSAAVYRVLITLQSREIVEFEEQTQLWYIGAGAFRVGSVFLNRPYILQRSRPVMQNLMRLIGETANLGIERNDWVLFVSQVESSQTIRAFFPPGTRNPMHASGIGKTLMANFPKDRVEKIIAEQGLERFTDKTITDPDQLFTELEAIKRKGFAVDDEDGRTRDIPVDPATLVEHAVLRDDPGFGIREEGESEFVGIDDLAAVLGRVHADREDLRIQGVNLVKS